ncbi:MAG TPA: radical SAM family heme chaperone HemW, partial [Alphaproteobacteria bacterium]|nr:radical SAM family heme chaperone HemW [Alphaproteobacteria bacterium]
MASLAIYVHWPFCLSKCPYCDFNSHVREGVDQARWRAALVRDLAFYASLTPGRGVESVFFGGGTPSLMDPRTVAAVLEAVGRHWALAPDAEVTLEANPTSAEAAAFRDFRSAGVNRVSLGIQALDDAALAFLGRTHSADQALAALGMAGDLFDRVSFDLIYARPGQTVDDWAAELEKALAYAKGHLSVYQLTIEPGTAFYARHERGEFTVPDEESGADLYEYTQDRLVRAGLPAYEVSNHAAPGQESRHNLAYWRYQDYVGIGPGAHGRLTLDGRKIATRGHRAPEVWLERVEKVGHGGHPFESVDLRARATEALMMGLRLREGVPMARIEEESGKDWRSIVPESKIRALEAEGYVTFDRAANVLSPTPTGLQRLHGILKFI